MIRRLIRKAATFVFRVSCSLVPVSADQVIRRRFRGAVSDSDRLLLNMVLDGEASQEKLDAFLEGWDIEAAPISSVLIVAYLMKTRPDLRFPETIAPRLGGVVSFCRFQNLEREAGYCKALKALSGEGIQAVIMGAGAMKVYCPDFPRWIKEIELAVPEADYAKAAEVAGKMVSPACDEGLFQRAGERKVFSVNGLVPSREDMAYYLLSNFSNDLSGFFDLCYLIRSNPGFGWETLAGISRRNCDERRILYYSKVVETVFPGLFPDNWAELLGVSKIRFKSFVYSSCFR